MAARDPRTCQHRPETSAVLVARYCVRCSAWNVARLQTSTSHDPHAPSTLQLHEQRVLLAEETDPMDVATLAWTLLRSVQEAETDLVEPRLEGMGP